MGLDKDQLLVNSYRILAAIVSLRQFTYADLSEMIKISLNDLDTVLRQYKLHHRLSVINPNSDANYSVRSSSELDIELTKELHKLYATILKPDTIRRLVAQGMWDAPRADDPDILQGLTIIRGLVDNYQTDPGNTETFVQLATIYLDNTKNRCQPLFAYNPNASETIALRTELEKLETTIQAIT